MIQVIAPGNEQTTAGLVVSALQRSCGLGSSCLSSLSQLRQATDSIANSSVHVFIHPREDWTPALIRLLRSSAKVVVLGRMSTGLATYLQARLAFEWPGGWAEGSLCAAAPVHGMAESAAKVVYPSDGPRVAGKLPMLVDRPFRRYDFADEWNNLGFGAITADGSSWSLAQHASLGSSHELARIEIDGKYLCSYAGLWDFPHSSVLWFNRGAGPVDSQEWRTVEDFVSCHRAGELPCAPVLAEVPYGFDSAVTMRLDCDEDVESARSLWHLYLDEEVPFSLALHTRVLSDPKHHRLPQEVLSKGGAVLSHTATHAPNWGGSYAAAQDEGHTSAEIIRKSIGHQVRYAVSPFHQTPAYSRAGLSDAGYMGCIGGLIHNDPDFLMARSGMPPHSGAGFIGHSQQCMLHGDCMLKGPDPLSVFRRAFDLAKTCGAYFGYLDHPFSDRYTYGWPSEEVRTSIHREFIDHIRTKGGRVLWANEDEAMDFLHDRAHTAVWQTGNRWNLRRAGQASQDDIAIRYHGDTHMIRVEGTVS